MKRQLAFSAAFAATAVLTTACAGGNNFRVMESRAQHKPIPVRAIVSDFQDERGFKVESSSGLIMVPLVPFSPYRYERNDELFKGAVDPFRQSLAKNFAKRLGEAALFESVEYVPEDAKPARGDYDVEVKTRLLKMDAKGGKTRYGLSFVGDILWYLGIPYYSRRWDADVEYQLVDGYTGKSIGEPVRVKHVTSRRLYTIYGSLSAFKDLFSKSDYLWDGYIDSAWKSLDAPDSPQWASLKTDGAKLLAAEARDAQQIKQGSPPVFTLLSPTDGANVRGASTTIRWSATAPGRLKQATLAVNNQPVEIGLNAIQLADPDNAPLSVPATEVPVSLKLGPNRIDTLLIDHRGNRTTGSYTINRLPGELFPATRKALLVGGDTDAARTSVDKLAGVLGDMQLGQFPQGALTKVSTATLSSAEVLGAISKFGATLRSGELAFIYVAGRGKGDTLTLGGGDLSLETLVSSVRASLPTDEVVLILDIDWQGGAGGEAIAERIGDVPPRWAFVTSSEAPEPGRTKGGMTLLADSIVGVFEGRGGKEARVSLERMLDDTVTAVTSNGGSAPSVSGRYNTSITVVQRE